MGTTDIVFLVIAFAAPLAASTSNIPIAIGFGNGVGAPGAWLLIGVVLALFSVGYTAMSRHLTNSGAFYAYVSAGLGRRIGVGAGYVALISYASSVILIASFFGFFASEMLSSEFRVDLAWPWMSLVGLAVVAILGYLGVQSSVRILGILLAVETVLLVAIIVAVFVAVGPAAYPWSSFAPSEVLSGSPGLAFAFAASTFLGFEATAIYSEEARDPKRTITRATLIAIAVIGVLYVAASWSTVAALGTEQARTAAASDPGNLLFAIAGHFLGGWAVHVFHILIVSSLLAVLIAGYNSLARYTYSLARDGWLPKVLAITHANRKSPYVANITALIIAVSVVGAYALADADPVTQLGATFIVMQALGLLGLMVLVSLAAFRFFQRGDHRVGFFTAVFAPLLSAIALAAAGVMTAQNFSLITGSSSQILAALPLVLLIALAVGPLVVALRGDVEAESATVKSNEGIVS
ncbi:MULTISPECIES: APC family permease [unclassified Mycolicibacterium]|uniref:APC family permease n=1 Tax=unclassified Mycolicibacterium TaxID=2636767 RepID=UPI002EDB07EC